MEFLRTPDACFDKLPGYSFTPNYLQVADTEGGQLRLHYVDEGDVNAPVILLLHGEPTWSFLYRHMIPLLVAAGFRVLAPDLIGFGRSDKPINTRDYTYARHVTWMKDWLTQVEAKNITLFCQDWGGLIGLRLVAELGHLFARVVAANTMLPTGDFAPGQAFEQWQQYAQTVPVLPVGDIVNRGAVTNLSAEVIAAYNAPYPDERYKAGARIFPQLVPVTPSDPEAQANRAAWQQLRQWQKPFLTAFSDKDPITAGAEKILQKLIPGTQGLQHPIVAEAGHFLQEDKSQTLADLIIEFVKNTSTQSSA
ncbi:haloalkane dehalogenase [Simiduia curdlanivorans]|uniref:Haloalkane dehalogenase n=1 Tax=Simiduia curdlanivorans TaxID=1492769 RepID=A0ABV8V185_9GAMM|nr:haloalkane dehalogenase [Simiduia curdlanivorans]MDN3640405.1 haloalkane dehalogenase [Simiduia curdlanivorans]